MKLSESSSQLCCIGSCFLFNMLLILRASRFYSVKHATKNPSKYKDTINLPKTKFPTRLTAAKRAELEKTLVEGTFSNAYRHQAEHNREPAFVLHDGPPYANGDLHMGHAVNKILKDITLRQYVAQGRKVHYVPGWDCHGLPIELKATASTNNADALDIRQKSRQYALDALERQKSEFRSWGVFANWQHSDSIYLTMRPDFIVNQLQMFYDLFNKALIYRDLKPVYWSPSSRTALAEAELEYDPSFVSPSLYVRLALTNLPLGVTKSTGKIYALVWTTTPWTLPSNQAVCYNDTLEYVLVKLAGHNVNDLYLLATSLLSDFVKSTQIEYEIVERLTGNALSACTYLHPINKEQQELPFFAASHVQDTKGTGLVHTAPAHGPDDFLISLKYKLSVRCFVDEVGIYTNDAPVFLRGCNVLKDGNTLVLKHIGEDAVHVGNFTHSYPIDWRTKQPVIIRASEQWFIKTEQLKQRAADEIGKVEIYPRVNAEASKNALLAQVQKRPYWCISRQRVWGVPIPVFYDKRNGHVIVNQEIISHVCELVQRNGNIDFWWSQPINEILPANLLKGLNLDASDLEKGADIFDIWFDSGSTWTSVLKGNRIADLYLEGYDQFTGWFQSSLLTSIAMRDCAPYKSLFVHGFTVDEKGHKMSKSLGNVISPKDIVSKYGVDTLRWWVASHGTQHMSITVSDKLLQQAAESLVKLRATLRYLNGVIGNRQIQVEPLPIKDNQKLYLNAYLLSSLVDFDRECNASYKAYEYNRVAAHLQNFVVNQISAVYVNLIKDRLYCGSDTDLLHIQQTLRHCYELLCKYLWPVAPFLVEESWSHYDIEGHGFHRAQIGVTTDWKSAHTENVIAAALHVKRLLNQSQNDANSWTLSVNIQCTDPEQLKLLQYLQPQLNIPINNSELCEILQVQNACLSDKQSSTEPHSVNIKSLNVILCSRCRRFAVEHDDCLCDRCTKVLQKVK